MWGVAPEVQVSHASAACLALAGTRNKLNPLPDAPRKLLPFGLHSCLHQVNLTCGQSPGRATGHAYAKDGCNHAVAVETVHHNRCSTWFTGQSQQCQWN